MTVYGNKVVALFGEEFQNEMDGAYVLVPVCPWFWSQYMEEGAYQYYGHFSWIYFFNNECRDGELTIWQWMAGQGR